VLADQVHAPADLQADPRVQVRTGTLLTQCDALRTEAFDGVFHLASAVSGECELDFDLGMRSNLDSTRALLDALRAAAQAGGTPTRLVFSSSVAVYGPDGNRPRCPRWWPTTPCRRRRPPTACRSWCVNT
jgi:nucleoside-diphosphate-sugar epimerase